MPRAKNAKRGRPKKKSPVKKVNPNSMEIVEEEVGSFEEIIEKMKETTSKSETSSLRFVQWY